MPFLPSIFSPSQRKPDSTLIHYHIFKNAGSSVDRLLIACFGARWASFEGSNASDVQCAGNLRVFLSEHPTIRAVSSHLARPPLPSPRCAPIVMLRHPIDRARSVFQCVRRDAAQPHHHAALGTFADFVTWALDNPRAGVPISNYQVYHLSDASFRPNNHQLASAVEDLVQVRALIASWPAFGLVREFAASCRIFEACYAVGFPELRLHDLRENASPDTGATEAQALAAARDELGEVVFARLWNANQFDLVLYSFACQQFEALLRSRTGTTEYVHGSA